MRTALAHEIDALMRAPCAIARQSYDGRVLVAWRKEQPSRTRSAWSKFGAKSFSGASPRKYPESRIRSLYRGFGIVSWRKSRRPFRRGVGRPRGPRCARRHGLRPDRRRLWRGSRSQLVRVERRQAAVCVLGGSAWGGRRCSGCRHGAAPPPYRIRDSVHPAARTRTTACARQEQPDIR